MHEIGLRILIRKVQLVGSQYGKALIPIFSYSKDHYMRVFFKCEKGKTKVDNLLRMHGMFKEAGPMFLGKLWDGKLCAKMLKLSKDKKIHTLLKKIKNESKIDSVGFFHIPSVVKRSKLKKTRKQDEIIKLIKKKGYKVSKTHFKENSIRSNIEEKDLVNFIR